MNFQQLFEALNRANAPAAGKAILLPTGLHLIRWGSGAPTGTPDAMFYFNTDTAAVSADTQIYTNLAATWVAAKLAT